MLMCRSPEITSIEQYSLDLLRFAGENQPKSFQKPLFFLWYNTAYLHKTPHVLFSLITRVPKSKMPSFYRL